MVGDTLDADYVGPRALGMRSIYLARNGNSPVAESIHTLDELTLWLPQSVDNQTTHRQFPKKDGQLSNGFFSRCKPLQIITGQPAGKNNTALHHALLSRDWTSSGGRMA